MSESPRFPAPAATPFWTKAVRAVLFCSSVAVGSTAAAESPADILRRSDVSLLAPESFRANLSVTSKGETTRLEVWRSRESNLLVRFVAPADKGKFLLRRDGVLYFIAPRAKNPVRLNASYRLSGAASLDEILGTRYGKEYTVSGSQEEANGEQISLRLEAKNPKARYPVVRYVVDKKTDRPTRAEFDLPGGKTARVVEFLGWEEHPQVHPGRLRIKDLLNPKASAEVEIESVRPEPVPAGLFDLAGDKERRRLNGPEASSP